MFVSRGEFVTVYNPPKSKQYKKLVSKHAMKLKPEKLLKGMLEVEILIFKESLKLFSKKNKELAEARLLMPITKPGFDNYAKGPLDALKRNHLEGCWGKSLILFTRKYYSANPRVEITVRTLDTEQIELL